jgi:hypothetical protein
MDEKVWGMYTVRLRIGSICRDEHNSDYNNPNSAYTSATADAATR